jgi:hypothetical protein
MVEPLSTLMVIPAVPPKATGPTWARLEQKHPDYDAELWKDCGLLYRGGFEIQKEAARFVKQAPQEPGQYYEWRLKGTSYLNHMGRVIGYLVGGIFGTPVSVAPASQAGATSAAKTPDETFYKAFAEDADLQSTDFSAIMQQATTKALVMKRALIGVDMPPGKPAANKKEEEDLGVGRAYVFHIELDSMFDWEKNDQGEFNWVKLHKVVIDRSDPLGDHTLYQHEFKIWTRVPPSEPGGRSSAWFTLYRTALLKPTDVMTAEDVITVFQEPTQTSFANIPIVEMTLPDAVWAGNQIGPLAREHFQRRSDLAGAMCRNLVEIPYIRRGSEIPGIHAALPSETQQNPNRGADPVGQAKSKGYVAIGSDDEIGFAGPSGKAYELASQTAAELRDEIFGAMNTMALALSNTGATVARSGLSKQEDRSATIVIQDFLGGQVRAAAAEVYETVADGRAEEVEWVATGADSYDDDDRSELVGEATEVQMLTLPSPTFHRKYAISLVLALCSKASNAEKKLMVDELTKNITDDMVMPPPVPVIPGSTPAPATAVGKAGTFTNQPKTPPAPPAPPMPLKGKL